MRIAAKSLAILPGLLAASPALASEDTQYWQTLNVTVALPSDFRVQNEAVFRTSEAKGFYELENTLSVGYKPNKHVTYWLGYTFDPNYLHGDFQIREHRFRQQVNVDNFAQIGKVKLSGRVRMEERFREGLPGTGWRLRPYVKASMPLVGKTTVTLSHESFIDLNTTVFQKVSGYERMRNAVSIGVPLSKKVSIDFGYLNQHGFVPNAPDTSDNVITAGLSANF